MTIKVKPKDNFKTIVDEGAGLHLNRGTKKVLKKRQLKSNNIRKMLFEGEIEVIEGDLDFVYKNAKCKINGENPKELIFKEGDKEFIKYLDTGECLPFTKKRKEDYFLKINKKNDVKFETGENRDFDNQKEK